MKKIIALSSLLVLGAIGMACGDGGANNAMTSANKMTANAMNTAANMMANAASQVNSAANQVSSASNAMANAMKDIKPATSANTSTAMNANVKH
jgi:hypothetical protein